MTRRPRPCWRCSSRRSGVVLRAAATGGSTRPGALAWRDGGAVAVVVAADGYPAAPRTGDLVEGVAEAERLEGVTVVHAGTALDEHGRLRDRRRPGALRDRGGRGRGRRPAPGPTRGSRRSGSPAPSTAPTSPPRSSADRERRGRDRAHVGRGASPVSASGPIPNVLATRYAGADLAAIWSPEHKIVLERRLWIAVLKAQRDLGVAVPGRRRRGLRGGGRRRRPRVDRRPRAGHPARREGTHRGVLRARRPRAHPQGDDLARPHRERRAAPGAGLPGARAGADGGGAGPARTARRGARHAGDGRPLAQRGRPGDHARQAVRHRRGRDAGRARPARGAAAPLPAARHQGPDGDRPGHARPAGRGRGEARGARAAGRRAPRLRAGAHQRRPGLPAQPGLRRGLRRWSSSPPGRRTWPPRSG